MHPAAIFNRKNEVQRLLRFIDDPGEKVLLLIGESGCGKTCVAQKAISLASAKGLLPEKSLLCYKFEDVVMSNESERFPQFLMDTYSALRPASFLEHWMRGHAVAPDSWTLRLPLASFRTPAPSLENAHKAAPFLGRLANTLASRYRLFHLENVENFGDPNNLTLLQLLANAAAGPRMLIEIGTLSPDADIAIRALREKCAPTVVEVSLFSQSEAANYYKFVHDLPAPSTLLQASRGNALAIRHYGSALAELPVAGKVQQRLEGFSPDAMVVVFCLAALRGSTEVSFLESASQLGDRFEGVLIELTQSDVVRLDDDGDIGFSHSLFGRYFLSDRFSVDLDRFGRTRIIAHLEAKRAPLLSDARELAKQHYSRGDFAAAWRWSFKTACESYRQENFRGVLELAEMLDEEKDVDSRSRLQAQMLLLQTAIRIGDTEAVMRRSQAIEGENGAVATVLRAQALHVMNRFPESVEMCARIAHLTNEQFLVPRALGIKAANLIAIGAHDEAADDFALACRLARSLCDEELETELLRLSLELDPSEVWEMKFSALRESRIPDRFPYLYARCVHATASTSN